MQDFSLWNHLSLPHFKEGKEFIMKLIIVNIKITVSGIIHVKCLTLSIYFMIENCFLREPYGIIKLKNFPFLYWANAKYVWLIIVEKGMKVKPNFQAFDKLLQNKHCIEYVKIKTHGDPRANCNCRSPSPPKLMPTGNEVEISFITGPNKRQNTGLLLKHLSYRKSKVPIVLFESIKTVTLNKKGM